MEPDFFPSRFGAFILALSSWNGNNVKGSMKGHMMSKTGKCQKIKMQGFVQTGMICNFVLKGKLEKSEPERIGFQPLDPKMYA